MSTRVAAVPAGRHGQVLFAILALSMLLKVAATIPARGAPFFGDSLEYVTTAVRFDRTRDLNSTGRPPAYPLLLGLSYSASRYLRENWNAGVTLGDFPRFVQIVWSTITVFAVYLLGRELFDARAALWAAALVAFYPNFVGFTTLFWTETLFTMLLVVWLVLLLRGVRQRRWSLLAGAGAVAGCAAVTRQFGVVLLLIAVVWTVVSYPASHKRRIAAAAVVALSAALAIAPVTIRNYYTHGGFVLVSTTSGWAALWGTGVHPLAEIGQVERPGVRSEAYESDILASQRARQIIAEDPRGWLRKVVFTNAPDLWNPGHDGVVQYLSEGAYRGLTTRLARALMALIFASYVVVMIAGLTGMALAPRQRVVALFWLILAAYCVVHAVPGGLPRHRLPFMACAATFAGFLLSRRAAELRSLLRPARVALACVLLALFAWALNRPSLHYTRMAWRKAGRIDAVMKSVPDSASQVQSPAITRLE